MQNQILKEELLLAAKTNVNVLLTGPTGTGKSTFALEIHKRSARSTKPFLSINLATLHEGTLESELFGHERGAFTGASEKRVGRLELAQGGTVFLDEVGELPLRLQTRLLEFLQSHTIYSVGSNREIQLDVRVIAATHKNLNLAVKSGEFREDLFHRLRVISMDLKPLIERADEFDHLLHNCLEDICRTHGKKLFKISEEVAHCFENYSWPGNFRELRNVLEYAVLASSNHEMRMTDLPSWFLKDVAQGKNSEEEGWGAKRSLLGVRLLGKVEFPLSLDFQESLTRFEKEYLRLALHYFRGRINRTAREIGLNKTTLRRRIRAYGLDAVGYF